MSEINTLFEYLFFPLSIFEQDFDDEQKEKEVFAELKKRGLSKADALAYAEKFLREYGGEENNYQYN